MKISTAQTTFPAPSAADRTKAAQTVSSVDKQLELEKLRLRKATKELESFFFLHMLKAMRETIPKSDLLGGGLGQDMYTSMFDEELSTMMTGGSASLAEALYRSLEKNLTAETVPSTTGDGGHSTSVLEGADVPAGISESGDPIESVKAVGDEPAVAVASSDPIVPRMETAPNPKTVPVAVSRPKIASDKVLESYGPTIEEASRKYAVDSTLIYSVIMTESGGDPKAVSPKGAKGLMQLMDATAEQLGVADSLNPQQNIDGGAKYLRRLLDKYDGDLKRTLAAYNAGPGAVDKHNGVPPYSETRRYVDKVMGHLSRIQRRTTPVTNPKGNQPDSRQE